MLWVSLYAFCFALSPPHSSFRVREAQVLHPLRVSSWSSTTRLPTPCVGPNYSARAVHAPARSPRLACAPLCLTRVACAPARWPGWSAPHGGRTVALDVCSAPRVTFCRVVVPLRGPGQSPVRPFACCVGSLLSVGRCGRCSRWCRFRVRGAQSLVCRGCAGCGGMCRLRVSGAQ